MSRDLPLDARRDAVLVDRDGIAHVLRNVLGNVASEADSGPAPPPAPAPPLGAAARARVLLLEDHQDSADTLSMVLQMKGYAVRVARTIAEARALQAACEVVISDISLPDGTGLDFIRELRQLRPVHAIALSGYGTEEDVRRSREAGFEDHLVKPVDMKRLLATVERLAAEPLQS